MSSRCSLFCFSRVKETIIEPQIPKEFTNDLLHGDLVGRVLQKTSGAKVFVSQVDPIDSQAVNPIDGSFAFRELRIGNYNVAIRTDSYRIYQNANVQIQYRHCERSEAIQCHFVLMGWIRPAAPHTG